MTKDQLLAPRYKVIADYPDSPYTIGDILSFQQWGGDLKKWAHYNDEGIFMGFTDDFDEYPHIFKPLQWWEERKAEDMPEYVKIIEKPTLTGEKCNIGNVVKIHRHFTNSWDYHCIYGCQAFGKDFLSYSKTYPATREDYESYLKEKEVEK